MISSTRSLKFTRYHWTHRPDHSNQFSPCCLAPTQVNLLLCNSVFLFLPEYSSKSMSKAKLREMVVELLLTQPASFLLSYNVSMFGILLLSALSYSSRMSSRCCLMDWKNTSHLVCKCFIYFLFSLSVSATVIDLFTVLQLKLSFFLLMIMSEMFSKVLDAFNISHSSNVNLFYENQVLLNCLVKMSSQHVAINYSTESSHLTFLDSRDC